VESKKDLIFWVTEWAMLALFWLLLVGKLEWSEIWIGMIASGSAITAATRVKGKNFARFYPEAHWIFEAWQLPGYLISESALIYQVLFESLFLRKQANSHIQAVPFQFGGSDERSVTRRALAIVLTTIPPNFVVIGIDQQQNLMLVHHIRATRVPKLTLILGKK
jgi:multisubunit Na+/H+ antiporter MnhE subunit